MADLGTLPPLPALLQADAEDRGQGTQQPHTHTHTQAQMTKLNTSDAVLVPGWSWPAPMKKNRWAQSAERNRRRVYDSSVPLTTICLMERIEGKALCE